MIKKKKLHPKIDIGMQGNQGGNIILDDVALLKALHLKYYHSELHLDTWWMNVKVYKCVFDIWVYQEIITQLKPDVIIETGTARGGSALFMAHVCDNLDKGNIITIDIKKRKVPKHKRIQYIIGSSIDKKIIKRLDQLLFNRPTKIMVILDSVHTREYVAEELKLYSHFVTKGQYLIVEDTNLGGNPIQSVGGRGPMAAVEEFILKDKRFVIDRSKEKFGLTFNPYGYLLRR